MLSGHVISDAPNILFLEVRSDAVEPIAAERLQVGAVAPDPGIIIEVVNAQEPIAAEDPQDEAVAPGPEIVGNLGEVGNAPDYPKPRRSSPGK